MSTALTAPPATGTGSLLRAEAHRFRSRRFLQVLLGLALIGWLAAMAIGLTQFGTPSDTDLAAARQQVAETVTASNEGRAQCLTDPLRPTDQPAEVYCGEPLTAADFPLNQFLDPAPFSLEQNATDGAMGFGAAAAVLCFLVGATWIGAEWSTRSIVALLFWQPRRTRVMGAKIAVLAGATAVFGALAQAAWLGMAGLLNAVAGDGAGVPEGFWGDLVAVEARCVLLTVLAGLLGFGLANLTRNTGAALGVGFVYFAVVETAVRLLRPTWQPWLLTNNAVALIDPHGLRLFIDDGTRSPDGFSSGREYLIGHLHSGVLLGVVTAVVVGVGVVLFARRDLH